MLFDIQRFGSPPWDPVAEGLPDLPLTLALVNEQLAFEGLKLIRVERASPADHRQAYVLVRLDSREIHPPRVYGMLQQAVADLIPHGV